MDDDQKRRLPRGSFLAERSGGLLGALRRGRRTSPLPDVFAEKMQAAGLEVYDRQAASAELGGYLAGRPGYEPSFAAEAIRAAREL